MNIRVSIKCPQGAEICLRKMRAVLEPIETWKGPWPSTDEWSRILPTWFVSACSASPSAEESRAWLEHWRTLPQAEQTEMTRKLEWSLENWLYWMKPEQATWHWVSASTTSNIELDVVLDLEGWPTALGAFEWLARAAGADGDIAI